MSDRPEMYMDPKCPWCGHNGMFPPCENCGYENLWVGPSKEGLPSFRGSAFFLSNFFPGNHATTEHVFQSLKTKDGLEALHVLQASTPYEAKKRGRRVTLRDDWEEIKETVMFGLLCEKFPNDRHHWMTRQLLATGEKDLIEINNWHDTYWGVCNGFCKKHHRPFGKNRLGELLMEVRDGRK